MNLKVGQLWQHNRNESTVLEIINCATFMNKFLVREIHSDIEYWYFDTMIYKNYHFVSGPQP
jgi:hypothetical protein